MSLIFNELIQYISHINHRNLNKKIENEIVTYSKISINFIQNVSAILNNLSCELSACNHHFESLIQNIYQERPENDSTSISLLNRKRINDTDPVVKTVKNKKVVYTLRSNKPSKIKYKLEDDNDSGEEEEDETEGKANRRNRKSKYRGVSKNGNQWQALIMINKKKIYIGVYSSEEKAGRAYDRAAIINHGDKAKTNFMYSMKEIDEIKSHSSKLKSLLSIL